jgi:hypothetical protein
MIRRHLPTRSGILCILLCAAPWTALCYIWLHDIHV